MSRCLSVTEGSRLDAHVRDQVDRDRALLCGDLPRSCVRRSDGYRPYGGGYISLQQLSNLIAWKLMEWSAINTLDPNAIYSLLRKDRYNRGLPLDLMERQTFLEAVESVFNECFDVARKKGRLANRGPGDYLKFLQSDIGAPSRRPGVARSRGPAGATCSESSSR